MARSISEIQTQIIAAVQADTTLSGLSSTSVTAIWRLWTFVVATAIWTLEVLFDAFKSEVTELVAAQKAHTLRWYQTKALAFQLGGTLGAGSDVYNNTGLTDDQVTAQKIVTNAAVSEVDNQLIIKVAKTVSGELQPLESGEITAITTYLTEIKDAGVKLILRSVAADRLKVVVDVYYDATVLSSTGARLDGTSSTPVQEAAKAFLLELPFDGQFVKSHLVDKLQAVDGVIVPEIRLCQARRNDDPSFSAVDVFYQPFSGFLKYYTPSTDLILNFIAA